MSFKQGLFSSIKNLRGKMHHRGKHQLRQRPYILPIFGLVLGLAVVTTVVLANGGDTFTPSNSHVVFLYDKGKKQTLDTRLSTVGELIDKLPLNLIAEDVVEPSRDTEILEDNFRINVYRARPVTVVDTQSRKVTLTAQKSPRVVAQNAGLQVFAEDNVSFAPGDIDKNILGEQVIIERSTPVSLNLYGEPLTIRTQAKTVEDMLKEKKISLDTGDQVQPEPKTLLSPNIQVFVVRSGVKLASIIQPVPPPIETVHDPSLTHGTTAVRQKGVAGEELVTYLVELQNGQEVGRKVLQKVITKAPVPRIVAVGAAPFSGSLQTWLYKLRMCESHGNYQANTGNGYYGAYQFLPSTWRTLGTGFDNPIDAPPAVQDQAVIKNTLRASGGLASQHPGCYKSQGLSKFPPPG